ncbi:MAG: CDP-diacylglycerol--serine O-phosphatidyltransferase [Muribaculaceae bacterium]|nr:CDP-diacylglycerol--serine O-phosphatidyltransferase [Muribaculaceae bacterium]
MFTKIKNNIPNAITCLNLVGGVMAIIFSFRSFDEIAWGLQGYQMAMLMIAFAALMDYLDGFAARLLHAVSPLGAELDSLSDCVSFGLAPAMILFNLLQGVLGDSAWCYLTLLIPVAGALRLARFNVDTEQTTTFTGLPIPGNAIFWIGFCSFYAEHTAAVPLWVVIVSIVVLSWLMISGLRIFSLKIHSLSVKENYRQYLLVAGAVVFCAISGIAGLAYLIIYYVLLSIIFPEKKEA